MTNDQEITNKFQTFLPRLAAAFLDGAALAPLQWIDQFFWSTTISIPLLSVWLGLQAAIYIAYEIGFVAVCGQTPGKMICGVKILSSDESPVTLKKAFLRQILQGSTSLGIFIFQINNILTGHLENHAFGNIESLYWVSGIAFFWVFIEFLTMMFNEKRRSIHDFIGGTVVVRIIEKRRGWLFWLLISLLIINFVKP